MVRGQRRKVRVRVRAWAGEAATTPRAAAGYYPHPSDTGSSRQHFRAVPPPVSCRLQGALPTASPVQPGMTAGTPRHIKSGCLPITSSDVVEGRNQEVAEG